MYDWRRMTPAERDEALATRKQRARPWHTPPRRFPAGMRRYFITAACFEHAPFIGKDTARLTEFESDLLDHLEPLCAHLFAWCILPNHYHALLRTDRIKEIVATLGRLHGRTSYDWNLQEGTGGRQVWRSCTEREIRSDAHFCAAMNYTHHNPVKHGYAQRWQDWPWSSAAAYLSKIGQSEAKRIWYAYPVLNFGKGWDWD